jgi:hypothetical protein
VAPKEAGSLSKFWQQRVIEGEKSISAPRPSVDAPLLYPKYLDDFATEGDLRGLLGAGLILGPMIALSCICLPASVAAASGSSLANTVDLETADTIAAYALGPDNSLDQAYDSVQLWKKDSHLPITIGADHWWHVDRDEHVYGDGYGVPTVNGTYHYDLSIDPSLDLSDGSLVDEIGIHDHVRFRDGNKLRSYFPGTVWNYEGYAYAKAGNNVFKVGEIVEEFGIAWDNSWWEGVPYFDGYRFKPAYGASWDGAWNLSDALLIQQSSQFFADDSRVSGAIAGADANSTPPLQERNTLIERVVPIWSIDKYTTIAWGSSFLTRQITGPSNLLFSNRQTALETDLAATMSGVTVFAQYIESTGIISPVRYVSGGPSNRQDSFEVGWKYDFGPISAHIDYSLGWDHNPSGHQYIVNPGVAVKLTKAITLYTEYVRWEITNYQGLKSNYDDGFELVLSWGL